MRISAGSEFHILGAATENARLQLSRCSGSWNEKSMKSEMIWLMSNVSAVYDIDANKKAGHDGFESEKGNFIINSLSDREPVETFENWSDMLIL